MQPLSMTLPLAIGPGGSAVGDIGGGARPASPTAAVHPFLYGRSQSQLNSTPTIMAPLTPMPIVHSTRSITPSSSTVGSQHAPNPFPPRTLFPREASSSEVTQCAYVNPSTGAICRAPFGKRHDMYRHILSKHVEEEYLAVAQHRIQLDQARLCRAVENAGSAESQAYLRSINCPLNEGQIAAFLNPTQRSCPTCGKVYARRDSMLRHIKTVHLGS